MRCTYSEAAVFQLAPGPRADGQPDLPSGGDAELSGDGQRDYLARPRSMVVRTRRESRGRSCRCSRSASCELAVGVTDSWLVDPQIRQGPPGRYRTVEIQAGPHAITATDRLPDDLVQVPSQIAAAQMRTNRAQDIPSSEAGD